MSVFTYEPNPLRVLSPWLQPVSVDKMAPVEYLYPGEGRHIVLGDLDDARLVPEPQDGPVEYKLHLMLRPRRAYKLGGPYTENHTNPEFPAHTRVPGTSTVSQARQDRCQHLTTQLLWRLRQSTPYHASGMSQSVHVPVLPEDSDLVKMSFEIGKLVPGLEETQGALYEIGVADNGALVGITKEEMDLSISVLRWMAATLGCSVMLNRVVWVGQCEVMEESVPSDGESLSTCSAPSTPSIPPEPTAHTTAFAKTEGLYVVEAFVGPLEQTGGHSYFGGKDQAETISFRSMSPMSTSKLNEQLRVTLTGPTGSGKSTLLGALTTGEYDDGNGKGRLNSLKHRHEMQSGMTSTVTQELVGYSGKSIVNYTNPNIESWFGIHDYAKHGRLVFLSDSAGHPRFRRTTLRGLVGWAPHWTFLCISAVADAASDSQGAANAANETPGSTAALSMDHLDLCLKLSLPLVIVLTKSDLTNKQSLKQLLSPIWAAIKGAGRTPQLLKSKQRLAERASIVCDEDVEMARGVLSSALDSGNFCSTVPVVLESSLTGDGVGLIHALLREIPLPPKPIAHDHLGMMVSQDQPETLFHIEDRYSRPMSYAHSRIAWQANVECVVSGYVRFGRLELGQTVTIGPFPIDEDMADAAQLDDKTASPSRSALPPEPAHAGADSFAASHVEGEWRQARVVSIRNLRLSVQTLEADQVGTLGLALDKTAYDAGDDSALRPLKPRRGMVVAVPNKHMIDKKLELQAASVITAFFSDKTIGRLGGGSLVTFYVASIRAQARVSRVWSSPRIQPDLGPDGGKAGSAGHVEGGVFGLEPFDDHASLAAEHGYCVRLELLFSREWIELGAKIVILEGASREGTVLDGFVGDVVAVSD